MVYVDMNPEETKWRIENAKWSREHPWTSVFLTVATIATLIALLLLANLALTGVSWAYTRLLELMHPRWVFLVTSVLTLIVGSLAYWFRRSHRVLYGMTEVIFALSLGWRAIEIDSSKKAHVLWTGLIGACYLVVRGIDNVVVGMEKDTVAQSQTTEQKMKREVVSDVAPITAT